MRLTKIKLAGFKSFVDTTEFLMPSNLIGVVGPNGCGKSNIIDAVRWVMGETSAKMLRGDSMADVIFSGSSSRKPVSVAQVELVFDNTDGMAKGEFAKYNEISVKRLVSRDGQSKYYLNKTSCRKKDITDLFLGTGLGPRSYAIIEQGMISRIVESKPEDLRGYIEEAAGISKYRERRRETERRIKHSRENLSRLDDLRSEVGKQINHLKRQAKNAEKFKILKQKYRLIEAQLLALNWQQWQDKVEHSGKLVDAFDLALEQIKTGQTSNETQIDKQAIALHVLQDNSNKVQEQLYLVNTEIGKLEQFISHAKSLTQRLNAELQENQQALKSSQQQLDNDQKDCTDCQNQYKQVEPELAQAEKTLSEKKQAFSVLEDELLQWQSHWNDLLSQMAEKNRIIEVAQTKITSLDQQLHRQGQRLQTLSQEGSTASALPLENELQQLQLSQQEKTQNQAEMDQQLAQVKQRQQTLASQLRQQQDVHNQQLTQLHQAKGQRESLQALQQAAMADHDADSHQWYQQHNLAQAKKLSELLEVEAGWEKAVEAALGKNLQALVTEQITALESAINDWKYGDLSVVENNSAQQTAVTGSLATKVTGPAVINQWFNPLFISENLTTALRNRDTLSGAQAWITQEGILIGKNWLKTSQGKNSTGFLLRKKELKQVDAKIAQTQTDIDVLAGEIEQIRQDISQSEQQKEQLQQQVNMGHRRLSELNAEISSKRHKIEQIQSRRVQINTESEQLQAQIEIDENSIKQARAELQQALAIFTELQQQKHTQQQQQQDLQARKQQAQQDMAASSNYYYQQKLLLQSLHSKMSSTEHSITRMQQQCDKLRERQTHLKQQISQDKNPIQGNQIELEKLLEKRLETEKQRDVLRQQMQVNTAELEQLKRQRNDHNASIEHARTKLENSRLEHQSHKLKAQAYIEQITEKGHEAQQLLAEIPAGQDIEYKNNELTAMNSSIERLQPVNLAAISEYEQESQRKEYLDKQNDDLVEALKTLEQAIHTIDKKTRTLFKDTFDAINTNIKQLFPKLFGGGHCYLELTSDDLLSTGVSILARPPGKRISNIQLLSGGEKALTAVAMVFSIFNLNPAPFCMLDEVDAPLDDANVGRFSQMVKEMSDKVQFLFVTHNKVTMEIANQLNGVTMREPGVSRLVSVDLAQATSMLD